MNSKDYEWMVFLSVISIGLSQGAVAEDFSSAKASATIDWSHLQLSVTGFPGAVPAVQYTNPSTLLGSLAFFETPQNVDRKSSGSWTDTIHTDSTHSGAAEAHAFASSSVFSGSTEVFAERIGAIAEAGGRREIDYSIDGPGMISLTVPYTLSVTLANCDCGYEAKIDAQANFHAVGNAANYGFSSVAELHRQSPFLNEESSKSGDLVVRIFAIGPCDGTLSVNFGLASVIPEPETHALLLAGLGLVGFMARRSRQMS